MADLKSLKIRIGSIKKTQKITKAMKMVSAAKLRRARIAAENARDYSNKMQEIVAAQTAANEGGSAERSLLNGSGSDKVTFLVMITTDRGLCGGLNTNLCKYIAAQIKQVESQKGKSVKILAIGKKGYEFCKGHFPKNLFLNKEGFSSRPVTYQAAIEQGLEIIELFSKEEFDVCRLIFPEFRTAMNQEIKDEQLIPAASTDAVEQGEKSKTQESVEYEYEPTKAALLDELLPKNIKIQLFQALLETYASEQGARMTAMDNAVNNCDELIKKLNLVYNRTRQAQITTELIEIISASESV
jgi:F-type H+-transporting ATPase subunit gamma